MFIHSSHRFARLLFVFALFAFFLFVGAHALFYASPLTAAPLPAQSSSCVDPIYVDLDATGNDDGTNWDDAYVDLQDGLTLARDCVTTAVSGTIEVWVAEGIYFPAVEYRVVGTGWVLTRTESFSLTSGVQLYGGFVGNETERNQRDWENVWTILSGDADQNMPTVNGVLTTTDGMNNVEAYTVVYMNGVISATGRTITESTVLDGFRITGGRSNGSDRGGNGGGIYCDGEGIGSECSPTLRNLLVGGNWGFVGGAMYNNALNGGVSSPLIENVTFDGNTAFTGGSIANASSDGGVSRPVLTDVVFLDGRASLVGASMNNSSDNSTTEPIINNGEFYNNTTASDGGIFYNSSNNGGSSSPQLNNVVIRDNVSHHEGGIFYNEGKNNGVASPVLTNVAIYGNVNGSGLGGVFYNTSNQSGQASPQLTNVLIYDNQTTGDGGVFYNLSRNSGQSSPQLTNVTIVSNTTAGTGGAIYNFANGGESDMVIQNSILWQNGAAAATGIYNDDGTVAISYTLMMTDSDALSHVGSGGISLGAGMLDDDPLFLDLMGGDLQLGATSPAIDAGHNDGILATIETDLLGAARFYDEPSVADSGSGVAPLIDLGAYETMLTLSASGAISSTTVSELTWGSMGDVCTYDLIMDSDPYGGFGTVADSGIASPYQLTTGIGDANNNYFFVVEADCNGAVFQSETLGEFDFSLAVDDGSS